jgi:hypothetical protein
MSECHGSNSVARSVAHEHLAPDALRCHRRRMSDDNQNENEDWVAGGTIEATAENLDFFSACVQIDTSGLEPPDDPNVA